MINNTLNHNEVLNVVIDPNACTHMRPYATLTQDYIRHKNNKMWLFSDDFSQLYFEDPKNKCILIRGCKDEYKKDNYGKIELIDEGNYGPGRHLHGEYKYDDIRKIITEQANVLGINLQNIKKINIFDISHTLKDTNSFSTGRINEKVNALKALNELCPNCEHTKIASTACWGGKKDPTGRDLIDEVKKSIEGNNNWHENNIVEIDITPKDDYATHIVVGRDDKPHVSYCLDKAIYEKDQRPLPSTFTREIHLLAKGRENRVVQQTHTFQNKQYRVAEGEGGFQELSINQIRQRMFPEFNQQIVSQPIQMINYKPIQQQYISPNYKPQNQQPIIQKKLFIKKYSPPVNNVQYIVNQRPVVKNVMIPLQQNITNTSYTAQPIKRVITQIQRPAPFINNVSQRNNNYQYNLPPKTINNYYNNNATRSFDSEAEYYAWLKTQDYINWITQPIKNQYPEYRNSTFSFQPLI